MALLRPNPEGLVPPGFPRDSGHSPGLCPCVLGGFPRARVEAIWQEPDQATPSSSWGREVPVAVSLPFLRRRQCLALSRFSTPADPEFTLCRPCGKAGLTPRAAPRCLRSRLPRRYRHPTPPGDGGPVVARDAAARVLSVPTV